MQPVASQFTQQIEALKVLIVDDEFDHAQGDAIAAASDRRRDHLRG